MAVHFEYMSVTIGYMAAGIPVWNGVFLADANWCVPGMAKGGLLPAPDAALQARTRPARLRTADRADRRQKSDDIGEMDRSGKGGARRFRRLPRPVLARRRLGDHRAGRVLELRSARNTGRCASVQSFAEPAAAGRARSGPGRRNRQPVVFGQFNGGSGLWRARAERGSGFGEFQPCPSGGPAAAPPARARRAPARRRGAPARPRRLRPGGSSSAPAASANSSPASAGGPVPTQAAAGGLRAQTRPARASARRSRSRLSSPNPSSGASATSTPASAGAPGAASASGTSAAASTPTPGSAGCNGARLRQAPRRASPRRRRQIAPARHRPLGRSPRAGPDAHVDLGTEAKGWRKRAMGRGHERSERCRDCKREFSGFQLFHRRRPADGHAGRQARHRHQAALKLCRRPGHRQHVCGEDGSRSVVADARARRCGRSPDAAGDRAGSRSQGPSSRGFRTAQPEAGRAQPLRPGSVFPDGVGAGPGRGDAVRDAAFRLRLRNSGKSQSCSRPGPASGRFRRDAPEGRDQSLERLSIGGLDALWRLAQFDGRLLARLLARRSPIRWWPR